ncbi:MAG TPA: TRAM domain-containing protein, partial [Flexilinea sp.]|nr:TRAM domain-containing protein [Flexilinea sp.]
KFDRVGVFSYSFEEGTASAVYGDTVPEEVKRERLDRLMKLQQGISREINRKFIGRKMDVLVERQQDGLLIGRSYRDAPDIDGLVFVEGKAKIGDIFKVKIQTVWKYD